MLMVFAYRYIFFWGPQQTHNHSMATNLRVELHWIILQLIAPEPESLLRDTSSDGEWFETHI